MTNHVYKHIELTGTSSSGIEDAVQSAIIRASKTVRNMRWVEVVDTRGHVENSKVSQWQVTVKVGFTLDEERSGQATTMMDIRPTILEGACVRLEPLSLDHHARLCAVGLDPELWSVTTTVIRSPAEMKSYIETALQWQSDGHALPFAIIEKSSNTVVGSTRYAAIDR